MTKLILTYKKLFFSNVSSLNCSTIACKQNIHHIGQNNPTKVVGNTEKRLRLELFQKAALFECWNFDGW
jgi:hypothetical protein